MNQQISEMLTTTKMEFKHARVATVEDFPDTLIVEATSPYIPIEEFKAIFNYIGSIIQEEKITRLVFDKRALTVFHQPSMEWYFVEWKEKMFAHGLTRHCKILPEDRTFRESVKIGREKIFRMYPDGKFHLMDIRYAESLEDALKP